MFPTDIKLAAQNVATSLGHRQYGQTITFEQLTEDVLYKIPGMFISYTYDPYDSLIIFL